VRPRLHNPLTIPDDRGQSVPAWTGARRGNDPFEQDLSIRIAHVAQQRVQRIGYLVIPLFMLSFMAIAAVGLPGWAIFVPAAFMVVFVSLVGRWARDVEWARLRPTLLGAGRCASCAYPIAKLPTEGDGCVPCPECGAAWKFDIEWTRRLAVADAAAEENLGLPKDGTADDRAAIQWFGRFFGGLSGRRHLAMKDERGRLATIFFPRFPWKNPGCWDQVHPTERRALRREIRTLGWPWRVLFVVCLSLPVAGQIPILMRVPATVAIPTVMQVALFAWLFVFLPLAIFGMVIFPWVRKPQYMARLFLRRGLCPGCWADLTRVPLTRDGLRECEHCLAAWKLDGDAGGTTPTPDSTSPTHTPLNPPVVPQSG
jgi:hypothetical protein